MNRLMICLLAVTLSLHLHHVSAGQRLDCPANWLYLANETFHAADIHREILEGTYDYKMTAPHEEEWHQHWQQVHTDTAKALMQATAGCSGG